MFRRLPAETDMQRHFQVTPPSVHQMIVTLERNGLIRRQPGVARSIQILVAPQDLPILDWLKINQSQSLCRGTRLVSVAKLVDFELGQVSYIDFIGITVLPCG